MRAHHIASRAARRWYLLVGIRWQRWQSAVAGLYFHRVTQPVQFWRACGQPAAFRPQLPWWQPFVFGYLSVTGWLRPSRKSNQLENDGSAARTPASPSRHLRLVGDRRERRTRSRRAKLSARFRPHRWPDSSALQPLHSISLQLHQLRFRSISFRRSQTAETSKDSGAPEGRDAPHIGQQAIAHESLLAGKTTAIRREASPVAEDKAIAPRGFARCKTPALTVSTAIFRPLHFVSPLGKMADLTDKTKLV